jgi:hypothetical protein
MLLYLGMNVISKIIIEMLQPGATTIIILTPAIAMHILTTRVAVATTIIIIIDHLKQLVHLTVATTIITIETITITNIIIMKTRNSHLITINRTTSMITVYTCMKPS